MIAKKFIINHYQIISAEVVNFDSVKHEISFSGIYSMFFNNIRNINLENIPKENNIIFQNPINEEDYDAKFKIFFTIENKVVIVDRLEINCVLLDKKDFDQYLISIDMIRRSKIYQNVLSTNNRGKTILTDSELNIVGEYALKEVSVLLGYSKIELSLDFLVEIEDRLKEFVMNEYLNRYVFLDFVIFLLVL